MVQSKATTVSEYLKELPPERRKVMTAVRRMIRAHLPQGVQERMNWGMITYEVPLKRCPDTYNGQPLCYAGLAAQKNYFSVYVMAVYQDSKRYAWLKREFAAAGKKLDMGKACIRFRKLEDLPLEVIGQAVASMTLDEFISTYEAVRRK